MTILITGAAGFIGFHLTQALLKSGKQVLGIDNLNDYYDLQLKQDRLKQLELNESFHFKPMDISNRDAMTNLFEENKFDVVVNLAAQAGVRYSIQKSQRLCGFKSHRVCQYSGGMPPEPRGPSGVRLQQFCLRGQSQNALFCEG